jgi:hypothetical protein
MELFHQYKEPWQLSLWTQSRNRDAALEHYHASPPHIFVSGVAGDDDDDDDKEEKAKKEQEEEESSGRDLFLQWIEQTRAMFQQPRVPVSMICNLQKQLY